MEQAGKPAPLLCVEATENGLPGSDTILRRATVQRSRIKSRINHEASTLMQVAGATEAACGAACQRVLPGILAAAGDEEATPERVGLRVLALRAADSIVRAALHGTSALGASGQPLKVGFAIQVWKPVTHTQSRVWAKPSAGCAATRMLHSRICGVPRHQLWCLQAHSPALLAVTVPSAQPSGAAAAFSPMGAALDSLPPELLQVQSCGAAAQI